MTEPKIAQVVIDARDFNGWHVIGVISDPYEPSRQPSGVVAFTEPHKAALKREGRFPQWKGICGTARFYIREDDGTVFHTGHYDQRRDDALMDLVKRANVS